MSNTKVAAPVKVISFPRGSVPEFYMLPLGTYTNLIQRGKAALEESGADTTTFCNVHEGEDAAFLEIATVESLASEGQVITLKRSEDTKYCKKVYKGRRKTDWRGPHLEVTKTSAYLFWSAYDFPAKLTVELPEYNTAGSYLVEEPDELTL